MKHSKTLARRPHSEAFRAQVLIECSHPGASVAAIALAHGLNANSVHKWRRNARQAQVCGTRQMPEHADFVALALPCSEQTAPVHPCSRTSIWSCAGALELELDLTPFTDTVWCKPKKSDVPPELRTV